jgi:hypothetical protein
MPISVRHSPRSGRGRRVAPVAPCFDAPAIGKLFLEVMDAFAADGDVTVQRQEGLLGGQSEGQHLLPLYGTPGKVIEMQGDTLQLLAAANLDGIIQDIGANPALLQLSDTVDFIAILFAIRKLFRLETPDKGL